MSSLNFGIDTKAMQKAVMTGDMGYLKNIQASQSAPTEPTLPSWLPTNANAYNKELRQQYNNVGKGLFGAEAAGKAIDNMQQFNLSTGMTAANNASADYANRVAQQGGTAFDAGAVKAQALMPVLQQNAGLGLEKQDRLMQARMKAAEMKSNLAGAINNSRLGYLSQLAGTYTTMRGQNITKNYQEQVLARSPGGSGQSNNMVIPAGAGGGGGYGSYDMGYIPNQGPIRPAMLNGQTMPNSVFTAFKS